MVASILLNQIVLYLHFIVDTRVCTYCESTGTTFKHLNMKLKPNLFFIIVDKYNYLVLIEPLIKHN